MIVIVVQEPPGKVLSPYTNHYLLLLNVILLHTYSSALFTYSYYWKGVIGGDVRPKRVSAGKAQVCDVEFLLTGRIHRSQYGVYIPIQGEMQFYHCCVKICCFVLDDMFETH